MNSEESNYISLQEATKFCNYSQEYLSLRARQGKLKAVKFGRNWVTKKEWLEEYLKKVKKVEPPTELEKVIAVDVRRQQQPVPVVRFGFVVVLVFVCLITAIFHGRESFVNFYQTASPIVIEFNENFDKGIVKGCERMVKGVDKGIVKGYERMVKGVEGIMGQIGEMRDQTAEIGKATVEAFKGYFQWLKDSYLAANDWLERRLAEDVDNLRQGFSVIENQIVKGGKRMVRGVVKGIISLRDWAWRKWQFVIGPWREIPVVEEPVRPKPEEGAVVIPYPEEKVAEVKGKLEKAFSDKVEVEPDETGRAGVIRPLIKEAEAEEYLYLIVPVSEEK